jgi:hypothetical protein
MKASPYGVKRNYRKIDLYRRRPDMSGWYYCGSTTWAHSCAFAKDRFLACAGLPRDAVKANFTRSGA